MTKIAIFASGTGSNALKIIQHFSDKKNVEFVVLSNNKDAGVLDKAKSLGVEGHYFPKSSFNNGTVLNFLAKEKVDYVILAGFLLLVAKDILDHFSNKVINIHPALLPKYGGKGMYGSNVHKAVVENKEAISGITIHYCNSEYDEGQYILQASTSILPSDTPEEVGAKVLKLEHFYFPRVVEQLLGE
ncbi:phosphoribosylglycinamide formyltransferase [Flammeovirga kamogawensis]|uniref:Phosphoribosylglycinamide formyltransferase n=1 Tax=Flammeovirga kamogawensis TaxID=373891 RepID=A0ABX8GXS5_9BACT|nr:phosphoribosylglycinamide formyltransferase [Flammeovirga kamogawensis]MBB6460862.1 phosphoribosylglycinamide formyltransferase-1 [Flammeovirga kamogawensis]QWG08208.1 phosphoribosylglycinamide formyltransferase [Flammeovirga kamogawensis]TRX70012.1 phosphoribosylglycinamide formyltransferase [Flammeovirga kamogawensis]